MICLYLSIEVGDVLFRDVELFLFLRAQEGGIEELTHLPRLSLDNNVSRVYFHTPLHFR